MIKIRVHGRGGQGAVTFAHIISLAATFEGRFGQSSQALTIERRGAPTQGYVRIGDRPIAERGMLNDPDYVVVLDPKIVKAVNVEAGLAKNGLVVVNSPTKPELDHTCVYFDATTIALEVLGRPITNTVMLGGLFALGLLDISEESLFDAMAERWPSRLITVNRKAYDLGFQVVQKSIGEAE